MKKILATLLVATMLLSCLTFVGFAATADVYTVSNPTFNYTEFNTTTTTIPGVGTFEINASYKDSYTQNYYETVGALNPENARYKTMLSLFNKEVVAAPANEYTVGDYVALPIYIGGDGVADFSVSFNCNNDYFEYVTVKLTNTNFTAQMGSTGEYGGMTSTNQTGLLAVAYFVVKDTAKAQNPDGTATANVGFVLNNASHTSGTAATATTTTMSVSLTGLDYDAPVTDPEDVTKEDVAKDAAPIVVPQKGGYAIGDWASETFAAANLKDNVSDEEKAAAEKYSCAFATVDLTNKNYDKVGMALIAEDGSGVRFLEAQKVAANGAYGIVFFGTEKVLGWYEVAPAVMLDGKIIYDETNVSEL